VRGSPLTPPCEGRNSRRAPLDRPVWPIIEAQSPRDLFVRSRPLPMSSSPPVPNSWSTGVLALTAVFIKAHCTKVQREDFRLPLPDYLVGQLTRSSDRVVLQQARACTPSDAALIVVF